MFPSSSSGTTFATMHSVSNALFVIMQNILKSNTSTVYNLFEFSADLEYLENLCLFTQSSRVWKVSKYRGSDIDSFRLGTSGPALQYCNY